MPIFQEETVVPSLTITDPLSPGSGASLDDWRIINDQEGNAGALAFQQHNGLKFVTQFRISAAGALSMASGAKTVQVTNQAALPIVITPPASTVAYQNTTGYPLQVLVAGGTISAITVSRDNANYYSAGVVAGSIELAPLDYIKLTYTVAPTTMTGFPM